MGAFCAYNWFKSERKGKMAAKRKKTGRSWLKIFYTFLLCAFLPITVFLKNWAVKNPGWVEEVYARNWYSSFSQPWSKVFAGLKFSFIEFFVYALIISLAVALIWSVIAAFRNRHGIYTIINWIVSLAAAASILYFFFTAGWALNYYRAPLADTLGYSGRLSSADELADLCEDLIEDANTLRADLAEDENGVMQFPYTPRDALTLVPGIYDKVSGEYEMFSGDYSAPKPVFASELMNYTQITGIYMMFTVEANVNVAATTPLILSTACHEAAHQRGFAREDEANFIAYLVCREGGDDYFKYSGTLLALINAMNKLYAADSEKYYELRDTYSDGINNDLAYHSAFWAKYEGPVAEKTENLNNTYLKSNNQTDGVKSYGRMVDLLLAERRARLGIDQP